MSHAPLHRLLQDALWRWPAEAAGAAALGQALRDTARTAQADEPPDDTADDWITALDALDELTVPERQVLLARGLRLVACGALRGDAALAGEGEEPPPPAPDSELIALKGCGPKTAERLAQKGITSVQDLLGLLPRHYEDRRRVVPLSELEAGASVITEGRVQNQGWRGRSRRRFYEIALTEHGDKAGPGEVTLLLRWFRAWPGLAHQFPTGSRVVAAGTVKAWQRRLQMAHPTVRGLAEGEDPGSEGIVPRYPLVQGVGAAVVRKLCAQAVDQAADLEPEPLPPALRQPLGLPSRAEAMRTLHAPPSDLSDDAVKALEQRRSPAHQRLIFDALFLSQLALARRRRQIQQAAAQACSPHPLPPDWFGFTLTGAQQRAAAEIAADLSRAEPMQRLVQGDVGSGKTAVAFTAAAQVMAAGGQVAFMAPTEILAQQHQETLSPWVERLGFRMALLTAATPRGHRESILSLLAAGQIHLVVGTHALLAERVAFQNLTLAVVDEQHRFGVAQRARLRDQGEAVTGRSPHLLVMTATPIPRTLALTVYGDLDLSVIDELPPGRLTAKTHVFTVGQRTKLYTRVKAHLDQGRQAFVVCPLVEESEVLTDVADAEQTFQDLTERLAPHPVGLLHGRLSADAKAEALRAFRTRELAVLVATTVVEVGVDIPDAELMVVESAQRFGLAQLHQLRGRVGRKAGAEALCLLVADRGATPEARRRLKVMTETADGFRIAEEDLQIRGPGELLGLRQAGGGDLGLAGAAAHPRLLSLAREQARALVREDPGLQRPEHQIARQLMEARWTGRIFGEETG